MTDAEALRRLKQAGWRVERRAKGSHVIMARGAEREVFAIGRDGKRGVPAGLRAAVKRATATPA